MVSVERQSEVLDGSMTLQRVGAVLNNTQIKISDRHINVKVITFATTYQFRYLTHSTQVLVKLIKTNATKYTCISHQVDNILLPTQLRTTSACSTAKVYST